MVIVGLFQFGMANTAYGQKHAERFPVESIPGVKLEWDRYVSKCYTLLTLDIGNKELFDIYNSLQKQAKHCKQLVSAGTSMSIDDIEICHKGIELGYVQCKDAAALPEMQGELKSEILLTKQN